MKYTSIKLTAAALLGSLLLSGCGAQAARTESAIVSTPAAQFSEANASTVSLTAYAEETGKDYFTSRDLSGEYDLSEAVEIVLQSDSISVSSECVSVSGSVATITSGGTYLLSGTLEDGSIIVDVPDDEKVQLVLDGVTINADSFAAIYVKQADKVFITLSEGKENVLTNGGSFTQIDDTEVDAVIFSKDDLTLNGSGSLTVYSPVDHGIVGKDEVTITGGNYSINAARSAIRANDSIAVADGSFTLSATDGLHAEDNNDNSAGSIYIAGGTFDITAKKDGIHATTTLTIDGGTLDIQAAEGMEASYVTINDGTISISASDDGINAARKTTLCSVPDITINGGNITIVMGSGDTDGVDANGTIVINGGTISVTGNSAFDYDNSGTLNGGTVFVNGQQVTTLPSQNFGGKGGGSRMQPNGMGGNYGGTPGGMGGNYGGRPGGMGA